MTNNKLNDYGYQEYCACAGKPVVEYGLHVARIIARHKSDYRIITAQGENRGDLSGKYRHTLEENGGYPAVGDYVLVRMAATGDVATIQKLLPRRSLFLRGDAWHADGFQNIAANFDTVLICMSLNKDFNIPRLERYLVMARESMAQAVVVLTKSDLCPDKELQVMICQAVAGEIPVCAVSAANGEGLDALSVYFTPGKTVVALGSSGVGKSTLVNALYGKEIMKVAAIREDDSRGRHTTVHRQIILLPDGSLYMDTPGMRELGLTDADDGVNAVFADIESITGECRFADCSHRCEPGCAVLRAVAEGRLEEGRYRRYLKYLSEMSYVRDPEKHLLQKKQFFKQVVRSIRNNKKP